MRLYNPNNTKIDTLTEFRNIYYQYINIPSDKSDMEIRKQLNIYLAEIKRIVHESKVPYMINYIPSPYAGGYSGPLDIIDNIFKLEDFHLDSEHIFDIIDRTIGVYKLRSKIYYRNLFNPLNWIGNLIRLPFILIGFAGFNGIKLEKSWFGKFYKLVASLLATGWIIIQLLKFFGLNLATYIHF